MKKILALILVSAALSACSADEQPVTDVSDTSNREIGNLVFTNGKVYTVNEAQPWAEAVAVVDNKIACVGDNAGAQAFVGEGTEQINLEGKMLMPGLMSGHEHSVASLWLAYGVLLTDANSTEEYLALIKDYADANSDEKIVRGQGWTLAGFGDNPPTAKDLDAIVPDRPAIIIEINGHDAWLAVRAGTEHHLRSLLPPKLPKAANYSGDVTRISNILTIVRRL